MTARISWKVHLFPFEGSLNHFWVHSSELLETAFETLYKLRWIKVSRREKYSTRIYEKISRKFLFSSDYDANFSFIRMSHSSRHSDNNGTINCDCNSNSFVKLVTIIIKHENETWGNQNKTNCSRLENQSTFSINFKDGICLTAICFNSNKIIESLIHKVARENFECFKENRGIFTFHS